VGKVVGAAVGLDVVIVLDVPVTLTLTPLADSAAVMNAPVNWLSTVAALLVVILVVKVVLYVGVAAVTLEMTRADNELATLAYAASIFIAAIVWACLVTNAVCIVAGASATLMSLLVVMTMAALTDPRRRCRRATSSRRRRALKVIDVTSLLSTPAASAVVLLKAYRAARAVAACPW